MSHFLCCVAHTASVLLYTRLTALVSLGTIRKRVTKSHRHLELFPDRSVMFMVGFLPPQSWVPQGVSSALSPHHLLPGPQH